MHFRNNRCEVAWQPAALRDVAAARREVVRGALAAVRAGPARAAVAEA